MKPYGKQIDPSYPIKLTRIGLQLLEEFKGAKQHHSLKCVHCNYIWSATPISKLQAHKKYGHNGCPECKQQRIKTQRRETFEKTKQQLLDRGIEILTPNVVRLNITTSKVRFKNHNCGHIFECAPGNVAFRGVECPTCGKVERGKNITAWSKANSEEWQKTATEWQKYKSRVYILTRGTYRKHKSTINPNNLIRDKAGVNGAHHLDHIVPVRYCFNNNIPESVCAHRTNLQMLGWKENVGSRDKLKHHLTIPAILKEYITQ